MKISVVHSFYSDDSPSGENQVVNSQIQLLEKHGFTVQLISLKTDELREQPLYKAKTAINVSLGIGPNPINQIRKFKPDVIHVHNLFPNWGANWVTQAEFPLVSTLHNFRPICAAGTLYRKDNYCTKCIRGNTSFAIIHSCYRSSSIATLPIALSNAGGIRRNKLLSRSNRVVLLSERAKSIYSQAGLSEKKINVIPNFVPDVGKSIDLSKNQEWIYLGRFTHEKGVEKLIRYWPEDKKIAFFGSGPLENQIRETKNPGIRYGGKLEKSDVAAQLKKSKGLIFPSEWPEGMPLSYCEAISVGLPVIALAGNSAADDVILANNGIVFYEWNELAPSLELSEEDLKIMSKNSRLRFEQNYSEEIWIEKTKSLYIEAISDFAQFTHGKEADK